VPELASLQHMQEHVLSCVKIYASSHSRLGSRLKDRLFQISAYKNRNWKERYILSCHSDIIKIPLRLFQYLFRLVNPLDADGCNFLHQNAKGVH